MKVLKFWRRSIFSIAVLAYLWPVLNAHAQKEKAYQDFFGNIQADYRYYFNPGAYEGQKQHYLSLAIEPEYFLEWAEGKHSLKFTGFARLDQRDSRRTHVDIREFYWQMVKGKWELSVGIKKLFWGVTESVHLVDIINQTDAVESFDGEQKLGQPMVHFSHLSSIGIIDVFLMPYFRKRQFPGEKGRLRTPFVLSQGDFAFESEMEEARPDLAVRWSNTFGLFDVGVSHFYGTGREPFFVGFGDTSQEFQLMYGIINQSGLDVQATTGPVLWKLESIVRRSDIQDMFALAAGFEYTFGNVGNTGLDIGVLGEYLYDDRGAFAFSSLNNDLFVGARFALNDVQSTELLMGGIFDLERSTQLFSAEGSRRIGNSWKIELETRLFNKVSPEEFVYFIRKDSFVQFSVAKYF